MSKGVQFYVHKRIEDYIKHCVGNKLKENKVYRRMFNGEEGRRCWTLNYAEKDGIGFHMDYLPCVPEDYATINEFISRGITLSYAQNAIAITHTENFEDSLPLAKAKRLDNNLQTNIEQNSVLSD